jgi:hypothetical protein
VAYTVAQGQGELMTANWGWIKEYQISRTSHLAVFFSHNKLASASTSAIQRTG